MKHPEQDLKDEYEQAVKRKGKLYAEGYVEGLKDGQNQALTIHDVVSMCCGKTKANNQFLKRPSKYCLTCGKEL